jgi:hypothetical protein
MKIARMAEAFAFASVLGAGVAMLPVHAADVVRVETIQTWAIDTAPQYNGRIPRQVYIDEMGRRWDTTPYHVGTRGAYLDSLGRRWTLLDPNDQGLTPAEMSQITGAVDTDAMGPALSGSDVQAGNMGPGNSKGQ